MSPEQEKLKAVKLLLGVTGGIAAYKAADLASRLVRAGATVQTAMTAAACELIAPKTFEALTARPVFTSLWTAPPDFRIGHVDLASWADIVVVAPATADIIAKMVHGIADDLLSTTLCAAWNKPLIVAPAMNSAMYSNPAVQANIETLRARGCRIFGPATGRLACGDEGPGRMSEPEEILAAVIDLLEKPR